MYKIWLGVWWDLKLRVFIAVDVNNAVVLKEVGRMQAAMSGVKKFVELYNLHFTLSFLGEINTELVERLSNELSLVSFKPFDVRLFGIGSFGGRRRVVWIGADDEGGQKLKLLASTVNTTLAKCGVLVNRQFHPHLTILRVRRGNVSTMLQQFDNKLWGVQRVSDFKLKQSILGSGGPTYTDIVRVCAK